MSLTRPFSCERSEALGKGSGQRDYNERRWGGGGGGSAQQSSYDIDIKNSIHVKDCSYTSEDEMSHTVITSTTHSHCGSSKSNF